MIHCAGDGAACAMNYAEPRQFEQRLLRVIAVCGLCYGGWVFLARGFNGNLRSMLLSFLYAGRPDFPDLLSLLFVVGFGLLLVSSIALLRLRDWGRPAFAIAAVVIIIGILSSRAHQFLWAFNRYGTTQPAMFSPLREVWFTVRTLVSELIPPLAAIWVMRQPEIARATQTPPPGGFEVLPVAQRVDSDT